MRFGSFRGLSAGLVAAMLVLGATPAHALKDEGFQARERHVPVLIDVIFLRLPGLVMTVGGVGLAILPTAITAVTRPTDILKPMNALVAEPFRFTFLDPLGEHSPRRIHD